MDNPVSTVKSAAKSAFNFKFLLTLMFAAIIGLVVLDYFGWTDKFFRPVTSIKAWNARRKAAAAAAK